MSADGDNRLLAALTPEVLALMDELPTTMFCAKDTSGRYVAVNDAFVRRTGERTRRRVLGRRAGELFVAPLAERYEEQDRRVLSTGRPLRDELELIRHPGGVAGWYASSKLPVRSGGTVVGLVSVSRDLRTPEDAGQGLTGLSRVVELVHERLADPPSVAELAEAAGCSPAVLGARVRRVFGLAPRQLVLRARLDHAVVLLTTTDQPLAEVALATGFYDQPAFTRTFAAHTGETPLEARRRAVR